MPKKSIWTDAQDSQIRRLRTEGVPWDTVAAILGLSRWSVIERGRRIGARPPPREIVAPPEDPARGPLPSADLGHAHRRHRAGKHPLSAAGLPALTQEFRL